MAVRRKTPSAPAANVPKFKDVGKFEGSEETWRSLAREDRDAGAGKKPRTLTKKIVDQQKASALAQRDVPRVRQPHWAKRLVAEDVSPEEMLQAAIERAIKSPNEATLREVEAVINELGRDPENVREFRNRVKPDVLRKIMKKK